MAASMSAKTGRHIVDPEILANEIELGRINRMGVLLSNGADPDASNAVGMTPLMCAVVKGRIEIVRLLLDHDADVNLKRSDGFTALLLAVFFGKVEIVRLLLDRGAELEIKTRFETSAEMWAMARGFHDIARLLKETRARQSSITPQLSSAQLTKEHESSVLESQTADYDMMAANAVGEEPTEAPTSLDDAEACATINKRSRDSEIVPETPLVPAVVETTAPAEDHAGAFAEALSNFDMGGAPATLDQLFLDTTFDSRPADENFTLTEDPLEDATKAVRRSDLTAAVDVGERPNVANSIKAMQPKPIRASRAVRAVSHAPNLLTRLTSTWTRVAWLTLLVMLVCGTVTSLVMVAKTGRAEVERPVIKSQTPPGSDQPAAAPAITQASGGPTSVVDRSGVLTSDKRAESQTPSQKKSVQDPTPRTTQDSSESSHSPAAAAERPQTKNAIGKSVANKKRQDVPVRPAPTDYSGPSGLFTILSSSESSASGNPAKKPADGQSELHTVSLDLDITRARTVTPSSSKSNGTSKSSSNRSGTVSSGSNEQKKKNQ